MILKMIPKFFIKFYIITSTTMACMLSFSMANKFKKELIEEKKNITYGLTQSQELESVLIFKKLYENKEFIIFNSLFFPYSILFLLCSKDGNSKK